MSYVELYEILVDGMVKESTSTPFYSIPPKGLVAYKFKDNNIHASIQSLKITADHKTRCPSIHVFGSDILISRGYKSPVYSSTTFYCAWLESNPHILIFWERDINNEITSAIKNERFIKLESGLLTEFCGGTIIDGLLVDAAGHELPTRENVTYSKIRENSADEIIASAPCVDDEETLKIDDYDDERDPNWSMSALREVFLIVNCFGDAVINLRQYPWQNMKKTVINEFNSEWERAIRTVRENKLDGLISESLWLEAMWLQVLGFPSRVRSKKDVLPIIYFSFSNLRVFDKDSVLFHFGERRVSSIFGSLDSQPFLFGFI